MFKPLLFLVFVFTTCFFYISNAQTNRENQDSIRAVHLYNEGRKLGQQKQSSEALKKFLECLEIRGRIFGKTNYRRLASTYYFIGLEYKNLGLYNRAIEFTNKAEHAYIEAVGPNHPVLLNVYRNLGNIYRAKLDYNTALQFYFQMINFYNNQKSTDYESIAGIYYSISEIYYLQNKYDDAVKLSKDKIDNANDEDKIRFYDLLAAIYEVLNNFDEASYYYQQSIQHTVKVYSNEIYAVEKYLNYTAFLLKIDKIKKAEEILFKIKRLLGNTIYDENEINSYYYRLKGLLEEKRHIASNNSENFDIQRTNNLTKAINWYKKALTTNRFPNNISEVNINEVNPIGQTETLLVLRYIANAYVQKSGISRGKDNEKYSSTISQALDYYNISSKLIQRFRKEISDDAGRIALSEIEHSNIIDIVKTAHLAWQINPSAKNLNIALQNAEQLKSSSVFDKLSEQFAAENSLIPDSLLQQEKMLNNKIANTNDQKQLELSGNSPDSLITEQLDSTLFTLKRARNDLINFLDKNYKNYYNLKYSHDLLDVEQIQKQLNDLDFLVEYITNETDSTTELYTITITKDNFNFYYKKTDSLFISEIENNFEFLSSKRYVFTKNVDAKNYCIASFDLYKYLIQPFKEELSDKKLIIIPDGKLNYLPFEGLVTELPDTSQRINFSKLNYLLKNHSINYAYSANLFFQFSKKKKTAANNILAFAPEYKNDTIEIDNGKIPLSSLPGTQEEVKMIAGNLKSHLFLGKEATELNFRNNCEKHDILHLAMHAIISDENPALSKLAFALNNNPNSLKDDGWLSTADIYNLDLNARLTVLSACNTGRGKLRNGEGVMSLARGFIYAGCPSIIMSLWEVEDNTGTQIMNLFYKNLRKGKPKDEALRLAKIEYLENANPRFAHPHYWQGFVAIGDNEPLYRSYDYYFFGLLILAIVGIITDQVVRLKKARKKAGKI